MVGEYAGQDRGEVGAVSDLIARARLLAMAHENQGEYPGTASVIRELVAEVERLTPREIATRAEFETLDPGTVVRDIAGEVYELWGDRSWAAAGQPILGSDEPLLPAKVIFVPDVDEWRPV